MKDIYLITGGTGFLGGFLANELLNCGAKLIFIARSKNNKTAQQRVLDNLKRVNPSGNFQQIEILEGDTTLENWGLSAAGLEWLKKLSIKGIWHLAANLSFKSKDKDLLHKINIDGLKYGINIAKLFRVPFIFISTAYVHGRRSGLIKEDELVLPPGFNNIYEKSKFEAEQALRMAAGKDKIKFIIFRPTILVHTNANVVSFFGYYAMLYVFYKLRKQIKLILGKRKSRFGGIISIRDDGLINIAFPFFYYKKAILNLMPIEVAVKWMATIARDPKAINHTFHIANPHPFKVGDVASESFGVLKIYFPLIPTKKWLAKIYLWILTLLGLFIKPLKRIYYYKSYITSSSIFDTTNTRKILGDVEFQKLSYGKDYLKKMAMIFISYLENKDCGYEKYYPSSSY